MRKLNFFLVFFFIFSMVTPGNAKTSSKHGIPINLSHLDSLNEEITIDGEEMLITHIYSEYPDYKWVDASGEGIACVDDVARAAIVYLTDYEHTKNKSSLYKARKALNFVMYMQADDGEFYNFVNKDLSINTDGPTSKKSFNWWAARGMWALGLGYKIFEKVDPIYAEKLEQSFLLANKALQNTINKDYDKYRIMNGIKIPAWIDGFDAMSNALAGLAEYYQVKPNEAVKDSMLKLGRGLMEFQYGDFDEYPFNAHLDWSGSPTLWHAWGSGQSFALAKAGKVLKKEDWIQSAKREADQLFAHLLVTGMIKEMAPTPSKNEQIAYGVNMLVQGFIEVYKATNDKTYAKYAGLAASWFTGNNDAGFPMYDLETGRGYDGLNGDTKEVNLNAGAESTIEAIMALQAVNSTKQAVDYLYAKTLNRHTSIIYEAEDFSVAAGNPDIIQPESPWTGTALYSGKIFNLKKGDIIKKDIITENEEYLLYAAVEKRYLPEGHLTLKVAIDGEIVGKADVTNSPDQDFLTLVKISDSVKMSSGNHVLSVTIDGTIADQGILVDNIVLQPIKETVKFSVGKNRVVELKRDFIKKENELYKVK
jgi:hypothetical protein